MASPSSSLSITTRLLTLSVHDSLTFDGVEVALNPDLFSPYISTNSTSSANNGGLVRQPSITSVVSSTPVLISAGTHSRQPSRDSIATSSLAPGYHPLVGGFHHSRDASFTSATQPTLTPSSANNGLPVSFHRREPSEFSISNQSVETLKNNINVPHHNHDCGLKAGDMIEIRVWEERKNNNESGRSSNKGLYNASSGNIQQQQHVRTVIDRAASKLQQHINQSSTSSSIVHPLAITTTAGISSSVPEQKQPTAQNNSKKYSATTLSSSKPPIVPRASSTASSAVASPMHNGPTPSLSPSSSHRHSNASKLPLRPRWHNESKDSIFSDDFTFGSNGNIDIIPPSDHINENDKLKLPFQFPSTDKTASGINSNTTSPRTDIHSGTISPNMNLSSTVLSQSFDIDDFDKGISDHYDDQQVATPPTSEVLSQQVPEPQQDIEEQHGQQQHGQQQHEEMIDLISKTHVLKTSFVIGVTEKSLQALKSSGRTQISLLKKVARLYNLSTFDVVSITKIDKSEEAAVLESVRADYVTLTIKDLFISRGEMQAFQEYFHGKWIYSGERLKTKDDMRGYIMDIRNKDQELKSGFLTEETKITFRSRSARIFWLVQISSEMWDYASPYVEQENGDGTCEIFFDKFISFMKRLFDEWKDLEVTHSLTIVFFSRTYIKSKLTASSEARSMMTTNPEKSSIYRDTDGRLYEDFYKTIVENITKSTNWDSIITDVKKAFVSYPSEVGWKVSSDNSYSRVPSTAAQGNILEAINIALNVMQLHYIDRDLYRCGNSVVVVSAGSGVFEVDKNLAAITKQRMMDNGIGSDMLSLGLPPLHVAPFFLYKESSDPSNDFDGWKAFFEIPHWMHLSFAAYDRPHKTKTKSTKFGMGSTPQQSMQILANGFVIHNTGTNENQHKGQPSQHLISDRDFEDILEACRPRNLEAASSIGLPKALVAQMKIFGLIGKVHSKKYYVRSKWGAVDFEAASIDSVRDEDQRSKSSYSTTTSHFANTYSLALNQSPKSPLVSSHSPGSPLQIQQSRSLELPSYLQNLAKLRNATREYDRNVFMPLKNDTINSAPRGKAEAEPSPVRPQQPSGGIGAAIHQYENKSEPNQVEDLQFTNTPQNKSFLSREPTTITRVKRALVNPNILSLNQSHYMRPTSFSYFNERPEEKITPKMDVTRHTVTFLSQTSKPLEIPKSIARSMHIDDNSNGRSWNKNGVSHLSLSPKQYLQNHSVSPPGRWKPNVNSVQGNQISKTDKKKRSQERSTPVQSHQYSRRRQWALNPFRQEDEDEVLSKRNHNARRWSHVFPQGEIEFKRQSGPNWRSLCQPAILPIHIDVLPSQEELNSSKYKTADYVLQLDAMDNTFFKTHTDLLKEMLRQRLTQDYQLVPQAVITESSRISRDNAAKLRKTYSFRKSSSTSSDREERENNSFNKKGDSQSPIIALSMGHRIQTMTLIPNAVNIKIFTRRDASNSVKDNTFKYNFKLWLPASKQYIIVNQTFDKYQEEYLWNPLDLLISGDTNMYLTENTRNRCISFRIIPDIFEEMEQETSYINKMLVLIEYFERLAKKALGIEIISSSNRAEKLGKDQTNRSIRFKVNLRKGKRDKYEWMEIVVDSTIDTKRAFGITFHWLVATSIKIDSQVKALVRKCPKLNLVSASFSSSHSNIYMHPFVRPECFKVQYSSAAKIVEDALVNRFDFCDDGIIDVHPEDTFGVKCKKIDSGKKSSTTKKYKAQQYTKKYTAQQYINRSATLFIRLLVDEDDSVLFVCLENRRHTGSDSNLLTASRILLQQLKDFVHSVDK